MPNPSFSCIFSVVTDDWCVCNCNTWAHLVKIWRHSQNSTCQFLFHHWMTWMTDPLSPMWPHIQHMVTITLTVPPSIDSLINLFWWKGPLVLWSQMASGLLIDSFRAVQNMGVLLYDLAKWVSTSTMCLLSCKAAFPSAHIQWVFTNPQPITYQNYITASYIRLTTPKLSVRLRIYPYVMSCYSTQRLVALMMMTFGLSYSLITTDICIWCTLTSFFSPGPKPWRWRAKVKHNQEFLLKTSLLR